jgi:hypothetical protein
MARVESRRPFSGPRMTARVATLLAIVGGVAFGLQTAMSHLSAQGGTPEFQTGKNVDIVGPSGSAPYDPAGSNPFFLGDPDKKQQNEPSCDISPNNPLIVFCGMNTYSAVDRPDIVGEPWVGASFTMDGGLTWKSHLHPGFAPLDPAGPTPLAPSLGYDTAADPVVRLAPGIGLYTFIAFNRAGVGALLMSRWYERTIESGFPYGWKDTKQIAKGTGSPGESGRFLDKPAMALTLVPGTNTYSFTVPDPTPANPANTRIQKVPAGIVHIAYAVFTGNDQQLGTKIVYTRSADYGDTLDPDTTLSESQSVNQAPDIATDAATHRVVVVWRRFADANLKQTDAIMSSISNDDGKSFSKPTLVANICTFTQGTTASTFRTTTHPFITFDGTAFHVVWAERQGTCGTSPTGYSRIVMSNLSFQAGNPKWSNRAVVDTVSPASRRGHEFQPAIVASANRILVSWMDTRNDVRVGGSFPDPTPDPYINDYVFAGKTKVRRRSADILAAEAFAGQSPTFGAPKVVSRYLFGLFPGDVTPRVLERGKINARMFQTGKVPFQGDYTAAAAVRFVPKDPVGSPGEWVSSAGAANVQPIFHLAWTDNRLVRGDVSAGLVDTAATTYTPPPLSTQSEIDTTTARGVCAPATAGTRDQTVMAARITPTLVLLSASASKPTVFSDLTGNHSVQRSYSVFVQNTPPVNVGVDKTIALEIVPAQPGVTASFRKLTTALPTPLLTLEGITLPRHSSLARTVYVTSPVSIDRPVVKINLRENGGIVATTYLNANPSAAPLDDPLDPNDRITSGGEVDSVEVHTPDILYRATSIGTPSIDDPSIDDPSIDDPSIDDPSIDDPSIDDPSIDDPSIDDPSIDDPSIDDPSIDDPSIDDPSIDDPSIDDAAIPSSSVFDPDTSNNTNNSGQKMTQITWKVALKGNTTTSMTAKVFLAVSDAKLAALKAAIGPGKSQLLISRRYRTSDVRGAACAPARVSNYQVIANVPDPVLTNSSAPPDLVNPTSSEPSFAVPPGSAVYLTLRVWGDVAGFSPSRVGTIVQSQPGPPASEPLDDDIPPPDVSAPVLTLPGAPDFKVTAEATSAQGAIVTYTASANDDSDGAVAVSCSPASGATFPLGTTPVNCSAQDIAGNTATGTFNVIVADTTPPVVTVPANILQEATSAAGAAVSFSASATDTVAGTLTPTCTPASGTTFPLGATTVKCSATDGFNTGQSSFTVTVRDTTSPVVTVPPNVVREATGPSGAVVTFPPASAIDLVAGSLPAACTPTSGATFPLGTTTVVCSASDGTNTGTGSFTVTVRDTTPPVITGTPGNIAVFGGTGGVVVTYALPTAFDIVSGVRTVTCSPVSGSTFPVGTTTVTCTAKDTATPTPNTATTSFTVTVTLDNVGPTVTDSVSPMLLWPPDGTYVTVTVSGTANDSLSGVASISWSVKDEYRQVEPSGSIAVTNGPFSFQLLLLRDRKGSDKDGRHYTINVTAIDKAGNATAATPIVVNVHDQSGG